MTSSKDTTGLVTSHTKPLLGFSLPSRSSTSKPTGSNPSSTLGKRPRNSLAHDQDVSSDDESNQRNQHEIVVGFGDDGAIRHIDKEKKPLIIERLKNRDWKSEARARRQGKNLLPPEVIAAQRDVASQKIKVSEPKISSEISANDNEDNGEWGLNVRQRTRTVKAVSSVPELNSNSTVAEESPACTVVEQNPQNLDEEALEALLEKKKKDKSTKLVIPIKDILPTLEPLSEYDAYKRAVASAPEPSNMDDYERVPVEEFGAALLRGMGWNGKKIGGMKEVKRRQNLLGLGAKELKEAEFLGAWVNQSDSKKLNPNNNRRERRPKAGEYIREEEKKRQSREERVGGSYKREREYEKRNYRERSRERVRRSRN